MATETYYLDSLAPAGPVEATGALMDALGMYLLDLMNGHGYRAVSGVRFEMMEPEVAPYPTGFVGVRAMVDVEEFEFELDG